jgi:hypothetical protein
MITDEDTTASASQSPEETEWEGGSHYLAYNLGNKFGF